MSDKGNGCRGGIGLLGALGILFIGLKLAGFIDWPWWAVLSPIWGGAALSGILCTLVVWLALRMRDG